MFAAVDFTQMRVWSNNWTPNGNILVDRVNHPSKSSESRPYIEGNQFHQSMKQLPAHSSKRRLVCSDLYFSS